jgi:hypothetical protein
MPKPPEIDAPAPIGPIGPDGPDGLDGSPRPARDPAEAAETAESRDRWLRRIQGAVTVAAGLSLLFGFLASIGARIFPLLTAAGFRAVAGLLAVAGIGGGLATVARARAIDRRRWHVVEDLLLTSGEREYAHKEAERERRWAGTVFLTAPVAIGYWSAYQVPATIDTGMALGLLPLAGYLVGFTAARLWELRRTPTR